MTRRLAIVLAAAALALAGCGGDEEEADGAPPGATTAATSTAEPDTTGTETDAEPTAQTRVQVYLLRGEKLGVGARAVGGVSVARGAVEELLKGPTDEERAGGLTSAIPTGTRLNDLSVADGVATVDLTRAFESGGGSASMQARVAQVVATLTQFPNVGRVAFRLDGEPAQAIGGEGVVVDPPLDRGDIEAQTPAILVEYPAFGETVATPLRIRGTSNSFEATFQVSVERPDGSEVVRTFVTATSGSGVRGTFDETYAETEGTSGEVTLTVWEDNQGSGEGGTPPLMHLVEIPFALE